MDDKASDDQIYADMCGQVSADDLQRMQRLMLTWAEAMDRMDDVPDLRIVFLACVNAIETMGPAYCRMAAATLMDAVSGAEPP